MRKIEAQMLAAVSNGRNWSSSNTEVWSTLKPGQGRWTQVYLHGNLIATVRRAPTKGTNGCMMLELHWQTWQHFSRTTFSRMNTLLRQFTTPGNSVYTKNHQPMLQRCGKDRPYELQEGDTYTFNLYG
tara:strand:- start:328 stop:711 length:384 start_codon:yes stop_codon:yes gene_type:complete